MKKKDDWPPICLGKWYENVFEGFCFELNCNYKAACKNEADYKHERSAQMMSEINHNVCLKCD